MRDYREHSGVVLRSAQGFSLLEVMTVVAVLGILATFAFPSTRRMLDRQEAKASATQVAGLLNDARTRALTEGTPHLVYFNAPGEVGADGECAAMAAVVRDTDHSYSITDGDQTREFKLAAKACEKVKAVGDEEGAVELASVPLPMDDRATRAPDAAEMGIVPAVAGTVGGVVGGLGETVAGLGGVVAGLGGSSGSGSSGSGSSGSGSSGSGLGDDDDDDEESSGSGSSGSGSDDDDDEESSGSGSSGKGKSGSAPSTTVAALAHQARVDRTATVAETVVHGATFPVDALDGRPVIAFSERGVAVDPSHPTEWGSGAGGVYLTDGESTVFAAVVGPLGEVQLRVFDVGSSTWR